MRTLDTRGGSSPWRRDLRLLLDLAAMLAIYWTAGARLRHRYRKKQARGETLFVDEEGPSRHREAPLAR
jgi:hypothetical protein